MVQAADHNPFAGQDGVSLNFLYVCDKESKEVLIYNLKQNSFEKRPIDMETNFLHNFQYCQTASQRLFVIGGGDYKKPEAASLKACFEIVMNHESKAPLKTV